MNDKKDFEAALKGKKVPLLVLDQKWHRLFAIHGKTDEISATEKELDELLKLQGKYNNELKNLKKLKSKIMSNIVANMGEWKSAKVELYKDNIMNGFNMPTFYLKGNVVIRNLSLGYTIYTVK